MNESAWSHLEIIGVILVPFILMWLDLRHRQGDMHIKNEGRLTAIETMIQPMFTWFTNGRNK